MNVADEEALITEESRRSFEGRDVEKSKGNDDGEDDRRKENEAVVVVVEVHVPVAVVRRWSDGGEKREVTAPAAIDRSVME